MIYLIKRHILFECGKIHTGEEEEKELNMFIDFLRTKNGCHIMNMW
jgi:hypothetical protein